VWDENLATPLSSMLAPESSLPISIISLVAHLPLVLLVAFTLIPHAQQRLLERIVCQPVEP
jgi:hypothetical protein